MSIENLNKMDISPEIFTLDEDIVNNIEELWNEADTNESALDTKIDINPEIDPKEKSKENLQNINLSISSSVIKYATWKKSWILSNIIDQSLDDNLKNKFDLKELKDSILKSKDTSWYAKLLNNHLWFDKKDKNKIAHHIFKLIWDKINKNKNKDGNYALDTYMIWLFQALLGTLWKKTNIDFAWWSETKNNMQNFINESKENIKNTKIWIWAWNKTRSNNLVINDFLKYATIKFTSNSIKSI